MEVLSTNIYSYVDNAAEYMYAYSQAVRLY